MLITHFHLDWFVRCLRFRIFVCKFATGIYALPALPCRAHFLMGIGGCFFAVLSVRQFSQNLNDPLRENLLLECWYTGVAIIPPTSFVDVG